MTISEAIAKMQLTVDAAKERLGGNGFVMSTETDYMNAMLRSVDDLKKAKYVTVSVVIAPEGCKEGDEYCMSLGAQISRKGIDNAQLSKDIESFNTMVDEAIDTLAKYEDKNEGLAYLTAKASEEYEKLMANIEEEQKKNRRLSMISNIIFIVGIALLFIVAILT